MVTPVFAGEDPYIATVGNDAAAKGWYVSPKYQQFMFAQSPITGFGDLFPGVCDGTNFPGVYNVAGKEPFGPGCEQFRSQNAQNQREICYYSLDGIPAGLTNPQAKVSASNAGYYEWYVRLPKKPSGEINLAIQCGVLKPNAYRAYAQESIEICAAETGERIGNGTCTREEVAPGVNPLFVAGLPKITAKAFPGINADPNFPATGFKLTAFKNPGKYTFSGAMVDDDSMQILDGSTSAKILLKACMDKTVVAKLPVTGQVNKALEQEYDLEAGDLIYVRVDIPRDNTVDIYCHKESLKVMGIGEAPW